MERYMLTSGVKRGGTSIVYKAYDRKKKMIVALKCSADKMLLLKEFNFLKKADYEGVPQVYDFFCKNDVYILVMEYIRGRTLKEIMYNNEMQWERQIEIIIEICKIINQFHEKEKVCYLDLKPSNIIVSGQKVYLIDFGSIQYLKDLNGDILFDIYGTPEYAAPETYHHTFNIDIYSDIYQIGCLLEEVMTNCNKKNKVVSEVIKRCRCKKVYKRYASLEEIMYLLYVCICYKGVIYRKKVH